MNMSPPPNFALVALLCVAVPAFATTFPTTVEVDLIFPRNDTYGPTALFPFVFAFQNALLAPSLDPGFDISLREITSPNTTGYGLALDVSATNFSRSDPLYVYTSITSLPAAAYRLEWSFGASNCSDQGTFTLGGGFREQSVEFTIQAGAPLPDLVSTATSPECANISHFAFNLTGTLNVPIPAQDDNRDTCAVLSDTQPLVPGNPCAVQVSNVTASSIEAALTATACAAVSPVVSCPKTNAASSGRDTGFAGWVAVWGGLGAALVVLQLL
ncbi:hypothetical protein V8E51_008551 [Hyaloscypha variabilis]